MYNWNVHCITGMALEESRPRKNKYQSYTLLEWYAVRSKAVSEFGYVRTLWVAQGHHLAATRPTNYALEAETIYFFRIVIQIMFKI